MWRPRRSLRGSGSSGGSAGPRWSPVGSMVAYTPAEVRALTPVRETVEKLAVQPERRLLSVPRVGRPGGGREGTVRSAGVTGVSVWFSEKDVALGTPLLREIDKGLAKSRVGLVLVTPALLQRLRGESMWSEAGVT